MQNQIQNQPKHNARKTSKPAGQSSVSAAVPMDVPTANPSHADTVPLVPDNFLKICVARSDERIANLPLEDQLTIFEWLNGGVPYRKIIELAEKPRPEGLDIKISLGSLSRFNTKTRLAQRVADAARIVTEICPDKASTPEAAFEILAQTHALHTMAGPDLDHAAFQHITRFLLRQEDQRIRQRALDLKQKRLAFDMQWKHYDIFKRTVEKLPEINEIVRNESLGPVEKFREHCVKVFGKDAVEMIERANEKWAKEHPEERHTTPDYSADDALPPMTPEEQQAAQSEAIDVMMGWKNDDEIHSPGHAKTPNHKPMGAQPDTTDQTYPL